jgi:uncharacterized repeat protein (TIGR01451 family)
MKLRKLALKLSILFVAILASWGNVSAQESIAGNIPDTRIGADPTFYPVTVEKRYIGVNADGEVHKYSLTFRAKTTLANLFVSEKLSEGMEYVDSNPAPDRVRGLELAWNINNIAAGEVRVIEITVKTGKSGKFTTQTNVRQTANISDVLDIDVPSSSDLKVTKSCPEFAEVGERIPYTITVTNTAGRVAKNVRVVEIPSNALTLSGNVKPLLGDLNPGESREINILGTSISKGKHTNKVRVFMDGVRVPAEAEATVTVVAPPQIQFGQTGGETATMRGAVNYQITLNNSGEVPIRESVVRLVFPKSVTLVSASNNPDAKVQGDNGVLTWNVGDLLPGQVLIYNYTLTSSQPIVIASKATFTGIAASGKVFSSDSIVTTAWKGIPGFHVSITDAEDPVKVGNLVVYEVVLENQGEHEPVKTGLVLRLASGLQFEGLSGISGEKIEGQLLTLPEVTVEPKQKLKFEVRATAKTAGFGKTTLEVKPDFLKAPIIKEEITATY